MVSENTLAHGLLAQVRRELEAGMRVRREQPHHGQRVNALTGSARLAIGEQLRTFINSGERTDGPGTR